MKVAQPKYVYLLSARSYGHSGYLKVGITNDVRMRHQQINQYLPFPSLVLAAVFDNDAASLEERFLRRFKQYRIKGEWFCVPSSVDIDCTRCTYREFMRDMNQMALKLEREMVDALLEMATGEECSALL